MFKFEEKVINFCKKNYIILFVILITFLAFFVRFKMLDFASYDYNNFLKPWFDDLKSNGGLKGLATYNGDYNAPYMTILALLTYLPINSLYSVKFVSIVFDFLLAISSGLLVKELVKQNKKIYFVLTYAILLFVPSVLLNGAYWCQCDSIYTTFIVLSLLFLVKEKYIPSFIMLGLSLSFKLQFIFILPLYLILYVMKKKFSILNFLIIPIVDIVLCLPAIIYGKPILDCLTVYFKQTATYSKSLVLNFPNIYQIFTGNVDIFYTLGEVITIFVCALTLMYILYKKIKFNSEKILLLGIWFITTLTFLLPGMHERYLFVGEVLSILYFIVYRKNGFFMLFVNLCPMITYSIFLGGLNFQYMQLLSIGFLILLYFYTKIVFKTLIGSKINEVQNKGV